MGDARVIEAIGRLERALARVERAAAVRPQPGGVDIAALKRRNAALTASTRAAVARLDRLLADAGGAA